MIFSLPWRYAFIHIFDQRGGFRFLERCGYGALGALLIATVSLVGPRLFRQERLLPIVRWLPAPSFQKEIVAAPNNAILRSILKQHCHSDSQRLLLESLTAASHPHPNRKVTVIKESNIISKLTLPYNVSHDLIIQKTRNGLYGAQVLPVASKGIVVRIQGFLKGDLFSALRQENLSRRESQEILTILAKNGIQWRKFAQRGTRFSMLYRRGVNRLDEAAFCKGVDFISFQGPSNGDSFYCYQPKGKVSGFYDSNGLSCVEKTRRVKRLVQQTIETKDHLPGPAGGSGFSAPLGIIKVSSAFGMRLHPVRRVWKMHQGVDLRAPRGTPVLAAANGIVQGLQRSGRGYGRMVTLNHGSAYTTRYAHLHGFSLKLYPGKRVCKGDVIGYVGATGTATSPHLHFEVRRNNVCCNPLKMIGSARAQLPRKTVQKTEIFLTKVSDTLKGQDRQSFIRAMAQTNAALGKAPRVSFGANLGSRFENSFGDDLSRDLLKGGRGVPKNISKNISKNGEGDDSLAYPLAGHLLPTV